jgi:uncharacterized membrane protein YozB (DUF420 family)
MKVWRHLTYLMLFMLALPLSWNAISYANFDFGYGFLKLKQQAIATGFYLPAYYAHVIIAGIILVAGIFQINNDWRDRWPQAHRSLGKIYVFGILAFSAPGALAMSFFINRGPFVLASFLAQSLAWFFCTYLAYYHIRKGNYSSHRNWMLRSYSLTLAAITLRVYVFASSWSFDLGQPMAYATIAWLSWIPNLLICEFYLLKSKETSLQIK